MLQNSLFHILHSTHRARLLPFFFPVLEQIRLLAASQWGSGEAEEKVNTHSVSLHSWKSRGSGESTSTLRLKKKKRNITQKYSYLQFRCLPVSVCVSVSLFRRKSLTCGPGVPLSPGLPGLPLLPCESAKQTLPFDILAARNTATQICYKN